MEPIAFGSRQWHALVDDVLRRSAPCAPYAVVITCPRLQADLARELVALNRNWHG